MALLENYLRSVRLYLPSGADHNDILNELSAHLQTKLDEREEELGRSLTHDEETAVLWSYGDPLKVAARYGTTKMGLAFGRELIGPEVFVIYRWILTLQFTMTIVVKTLIHVSRGWSGASIAEYLEILAIQFVLTTSIFIAIDTLKRRSRMSQPWSFPPPHMQPVPRWQSVSGFVVLSAAAIWWAAIPYAPFLLLGSSASQLAFTDNWHWFYWPMLAPLLIGAAQRLVTFVEPRRLALQSFTRLFTNTWAVLMVLEFVAALPYVTATTPGAEALATTMNNRLWWNALTSLGLYWLINAGVMAFFCAKHLSHFMRQRRDQLMVRQSQQS